MLAKATVTSCKFGIWALLVFAVLFAASVWETSPGVAGFVLRELTCVLDDSRTQWVIFLFSGIYFAVFLALRIGSHFRVREAASALQLARQDGTCLWLIGVLGVGAADYFCHYSPSAQALILITGALLGQGMIVWAGFEVRHQRPEMRGRLWFLAVLVLILLLAMASVWNAGPAEAFEYQGRTRWVGPWGNPNIFGLLMASGTVLVAGHAGHLLDAMFTGLPLEASRWRQAGRRAAAIACLAAFILLVRGLLHSYSRGAWLGTVLGAGYLWYFRCKRRQHPGNRRISWIAKNYVSLGVILVAAGVLGFWHGRQAAWHPAHRAFSTVNANDFSWRNRVAAWAGALQITAEHPWLGAGWNQPEPLYENYYLPPKLNESLAIQMNDYLLFSATLGVPALFCFAMYAGLSLTWKGAGAGHHFVLARAAPEPGGRAPSDFDSLQATCRAGALVLLAGFWFDGGLFQLPTAATFWMLLELGGMGSHPAASEPRAGANLTAGNMCPRVGRTVRRSAAPPALPALVQRRHRRRLAAPVVSPGAPVCVRHEAAFVMAGPEI